MEKLLEIKHEFKTRVQKFFRNRQKNASYSYNLKAEDEKQIK